MDGESKFETYDIGERYNANLARYLDQYDAILKQKYPQDYETRVTSIENQLRALPITHSTNIDHMPSILSKGLVPYAERGEVRDASSAILPSDYLNGLDINVFAKIGYCPPYGLDKGRVTLMIDDDALENTATFFTWSDLGSVIKNRKLWQLDDYQSKIYKQYPQESMPGRLIYSVLARTFLGAGKSVEEFLADPKHQFPPAYDPDFQSTNFGDPEIKIAGIVKPEHFMGYVIKDDETATGLRALGINADQIIVSQGENKIGKQIAEYKKAYIDRKTKTVSTTKV